MVNKEMPTELSVGTVNGQPAAESPPDGRFVPLPISRAVAPRPVPADAELKHPSLYFNQELSWVDFNWRVLGLTLDERTPLLERVRFAAITASNLDEFTQKRIGGLKRQEAAGVRKLTVDGRSPREQLRLLRPSVELMHRTMTAVWENELRPLLRQKAHIQICDYDELTPPERERLHQHFRDQIYPILTPLAVDPGHPFPFISNLSLSLAVTLRHPLGETIHFARLKIPVDRWLALHSGPDNGLYRFLPVEQLIARHVGELFPGMEVLSVYPFRITRNADLRRNEEEAEDLLEMISAELRERRFAPVVRLEVAREMPAYDRNLLMRELNLQDEDLYEVDGLLDLTGCFFIADLDRPALKYEPWEGVTPNRLLHEGETKDTRDIFAILRHGDLLVHHPYDSFAVSTQRFLAEAAADPYVLAIKQTLYRTSAESPIVQALMHAGESGKQVAVLVEVKARFDEENNIEWARMLENSGVHVAYGLVGLKTHTKATLVVRRERDGIRIYCHIGTGNYNSKTARLYTDFGLFTARPEYGRDLVNLFHFLTGYAPAQPYEEMLVAPRTMRKRFEELIEREMACQEKYGTGRIIAKMNAIDDEKMIRKLYTASQAGVQIDLIIRGHCCLRPQLPGFSENIRVISILGQFLEHDRIYYFHNNGRPLYFIGSADWRKRNLKRRVELITPVGDPDLQEQLTEVLDLALADNRLAWELDSGGIYRLRSAEEEEEAVDFHRQLMKFAHKRSKKPKPVMKK